MQTRGRILHGHGVGGSDAQLPQGVLVSLGVGFRPVHIIAGDQYLDRAIPE